MTSSIYSEIKNHILNTDVSQYFEDKINELEANIPTITIGVIGEFSSGKSSLINALIGANILPKAVEPTTGLPTIIEAHSNITEYSLWKRDKNTHDDLSVSILDFNNLVLGNDNQSNALPVLKIPASNYLPVGFRLIDSPGIDSLNQIHTLVALSQLEHLDCIILCLDINKGGLTESVCQLLEKPELSFAKNHIIFALTKIDSKPPHVVENVKLDLQNQIQQYFKGQTKEQLLSDKICTLSASYQMDGKDGGIDRLIKVLKKNIFDVKEAIISQRRDQKIRLLAKDAVVLLKDLYDNSKLDASELDEKKKYIQIQKQELSKQKSKTESDFFDLKQGLFNQFLEKIMPYSAAITSANGETRSTAMMHLEQTILTLSKEIIEKYVKLDYIPKSIQTASMKESIEKIFFYQEVLSSALTAIATATISGGTTLAANTLEAAAGYMINEIANEQEKEKKEEKKEANQLLNGISTVIQKLNLIDHLTSWAASQYAANQAEEMMKKLAYEQSVALIRHLETHYLTGVLEQLNQQLDILSKQVDDIYTEKSEARDVFLDIQIQRKKQIETLENY